MRLSNIIVAVLVACGVALLINFLISNGTAQDGPLYLHNRNFHLQTALYELYKTEQRDVVMLGNSLTHWVDWNELLGRTNIANRGIASDVTEGYLHRMQYVTSLRPKICFIEGGINDIYAGVPPDAIYANYVKIIGEIQKHNIIPVIQSTIFVSPKWRNAIEKNLQVKELNTRLQTFATSAGILFLDLNAVLSANGQLRDDFTYDGVHLNAAGYRLWGNEVERVLVQHGL